MELGAVRNTPREQQSHQPQGSRAGDKLGGGSACASNLLRSISAGWEVTNARGPTSGSTEDVLEMNKPTLARRPDEILCTESKLGKKKNYQLRSSQLLNPSPGVPSSPVPVWELSAPQSQPRSPNSSIPVWELPNPSLRGILGGEGWKCLCSISSLQTSLSR